MGNEDKVSKEIVESKSQFLPKDIPDTESSPEVYNLEKEFSATRKNFNFKFYLVLLLFLGSLGAATYLITSFVKKENKQVDLGIQEFEEVKLKDLLNSARDIEKQLRQARAELAQLREDKAAEKEIIQKTYKEQVSSVNQQKLTSSERQQKIQTLEKQTDKKLASVNEKYDPRIEEKKEEVKDLEKRVAERRREMREGVSKAQAVVNNYERLHNLKMQREREKHATEMANLIAKYNPSFSNRKLQSYMKGDKSSSGAPPEIHDYASILKSEGVISEYDYVQNRDRMKISYKLLDRVHEVPYKNSVPVALERVNQLHRQVIERYDRLWFKLAERIKVKNRMIGSYDYAFKSLIEDERESGFVIDPRNRKAIRVKMNPTLEVPNGAFAYIFRQDDEYIGKVTLRADEFGHIATLSELETGKSIRPFDRILLTLDQQKPADSGEEADSETGTEEKAEPQPGETK